MALASFLSAVNHIEEVVCLILFPPDKPQQNGLVEGFEFYIRTLTNPNPLHTQRYAEVHARFTVACVKHGVNISLPSAGVVQMLSEKKRIRAKLSGGEGGEPASD